jgi:hypothetical protein
MAKTRPLWTIVSRSISGTIPQKGVQFELPQRADIFKNKKNHVQNYAKTTADFEGCRDGTTRPINVVFSSGFIVGSRHCPTCSTFKHKCWGAGSKSQNKQPKRTAAEALAKF